MSLGRRSLLTSSAAGVGLVVAGSVPSLAEASPQSRSHHGAGKPNRPFPPLVDDPNGLLALHRDRDEPQRCQPRRVCRDLGHAHQLCGRPDAWGTWLTCEETDTKAGTPWSGNGQS